MKQTKQFWSNCFFGILYLCVSGKIKEIIFVDCGLWVWPWHFLGITHKNRVVHFYKLLAKEDDKVPPFWFTGSFQVMRRDEAKELLGKENRKIVLHTRKKWQFHLTFAFLMLLFIILFIPFLVGWLFWPIGWVGYHTCSVIKRRIGKR